MKAEITITNEFSFDEVKIGDKTLEDILREIHNEARKCLLEFYIQSQSENPDYEDIDTPLHRILNIIEDITYRR